MSSSVQLPFDWRAKGALTNQQINTLKALASTNMGLTRTELNERIGSSATVKSVGKSTVEDWFVRQAMGEGEKSLLDLGMVKMIKDERGEKEVIVYLLTKKGEAAANWFKTRKRTKSKVPNELLDPAIIDLRNRRTYQFELWTDEDIMEVRDKLGSEYHSVTIDDLRQQIVGRRKQGVFKKVEQLPQWYIDYRKTKHWQDIKRKVLEMWDHRCTLNVTHKDNVDVYHRALRDNLGRGSSIFHNETETDCIALCQGCYKRTLKSRLAIPNTELVD